MKLHVKKGDSVVVISGKDKDKVGEVLDSMPKKSRVLVSGVNIVKKHQKPDRKNMQGGIIEKEAYIHCSKVMLYCSKCKKPTRIKNSFVEENKKIRVCRHCNSEI